MLRNIISALTIFLLITCPAIAENFALQVDRRATITSSDNQAINIDFELVDLEERTVVKEGETFTVFNLNGEGITYEYGKPVLPAIIRFVVIPPEANVELMVTADEPRRIRGDYLLAICDDEEIKPAFDQRFIPDENPLYPPEIAKMGDPIVIRGVRLVKITTFPIQYEASTNTYVFNDNIRTELRFIDGEAINPVHVPIRRNRSAHFLNAISRLAMNGNEVGRDDPDRDSEPEYIGHYAVVVHNQVLRYTAPFIEWRRKSGHKVDIIVPQNPADYSGVKRSIEDLYDSYLDEEIDPFEFLLLVGDRPNYGHGPAPGGILQALSGHDDYNYACIDGNDQHADVGVSRWPSGTQATCELAVGRTLAYEAYPYMEDTSWFTRGAVYTQHWGNSAASAWDLTIHTNVRWGVEVLEHLGFDDISFYEEYDWDRDGARIGPRMTEWFNEGMNVFIGRAELYWYTSRPGNRTWQDFDRDVDANVVFPMEINTCGHGEWSRESIFRQGNRDNLKGPVTTSFTWSGPRTVPNSAVWAEMVKGILLNDLPFGWGYSMALTSIESYLNNIPPSLQWY
ncbi:hypothetical protein HQ587_10300, partial [bacterium]|nr:hypothetical protein [bacterium]